MNKKVFALVFLAVVLIILLVFSYQVGKFNGLIRGVHAIQLKYNSSVCDLFIENNQAVYKEVIDGEEVCVLADGKKYFQRADCYFGSFVIKGNITLSGLDKFFMQDIREFPFKLLMGCNV